jgi:hypothetical protein
LNRQLEQQKLELEREKWEHRATLTAPHSPKQPSFKISEATKLIPKWDPSDPELFLLAFERIATLNKFPESTWVSILTPNLSGKALHLLSEIPEKDVGNYKVFKKHLLNLFQQVPEVYRKFFCSTNISGTETYADFALKLTNLFKRWLSGLNCFDDLEKLRQNILLEQFF